MFDVSIRYRRVTYQILQYRLCLRRARLILKGENYYIGMAVIITEIYQYDREVLLSVCGLPLCRQVTHSARSM